MTGTTITLVIEYVLGKTSRLTKGDPARFNEVRRVRCSRKSETGGKTSSGDDCRVCRKSFAPEEVSRTCCECQHKVCEDCASYSTTTNSDDPVSLHAAVILINRPRSLFRAAGKYCRKTRLDSVSTQINRRAGPEENTGGHSVGRTESNVNI